MSSLNRAQLIEVYYSARRIYRRSHSPDTRADAKEIAETVEGCIGQMEKVPAASWGKPGLPKERGQKTYSNEELKEQD